MIKVILKTLERAGTRFPRVVRPRGAIVPAVSPMDALFPQESRTPVAINFVLK
ncbi:hypothetical protein SRABI96_02873 [Peribacillus sp. Bi96]|nr:hypothetical protein SRABI96_02873 [Peribacillus sp. Bi96]